LPALIPLPTALQSCATGNVVGPWFPAYRLAAPCVPGLSVPPPAHRVHVGRGPAFRPLPRFPLAVAASPVAPVHRPAASARAVGGTSRLSPPPGDHWTPRLSRARWPAVDSCGLEFPRAVLGVHYGPRGRRGGGLLALQRWPPGRACCQVTAAVVLPRDRTHWPTSSRLACFVFFRCALPASLSAIAGLIYEIRNPTAAITASACSDSASPTPPIRRSPRRRIRRVHRREQGLRPRVRGADTLTSLALGRWNPPPTRLIDSASPFSSPRSPGRPSRRDRPISAAALMGAMIHQTDAGSARPRGLAARSGLAW